MEDLLRLVAAAFAVAAVPAVVALGVAWRRAARRAGAAAASRRAAEAELLAAVAHDLRSPLQSASGWVEVLRHGDLEPGQRQQAVNGLARAVSSLAGLAEELADASAVESGALELHSEPLALDDVVRDGTAAAAPQATDKRVQLEVSAAAPVPFDGDRRRLSQALTHLVTNAVACTPSGRTVRVSTGADGAAVLIRVHAEGATQPRRTSAWERRLALARHIVERHEGSLEESASASGHTFSARLPARSGQQPH